MRKNLLTALFLFVAISSFTQDSLNTRQGEIYLKRRHWRMDDKKLTAKEFKQEIYKVPAAISYYKKSNTCLYLSFLSLASGSASLWFGREKNLLTGRYSSEIKPGFLITAILFEGAGFYLLLRSSRYLKKAIAIRNQNRRIIY